MAIWKKLKKQRIEIEQVYDLMAARIITPGALSAQDTMQCYRALGVVHQHWRPIPERFRDWIGNPREKDRKSVV